MRATRIQAISRGFAALFCLLTLGSFVDAQAIKEGDTVDVQYGKRMVRGRVDDVGPNGLVVVAVRDNTVEAHVADAVLVKDRGQRMAPVRYKVGDAVRDRNTKEQGRVISLDEGFVTFAVKRGGRTRRATSALFEIEKVGRSAGPSKGKRSNANEKSETPTHAVREWVDKTGKHKVKATFVSSKSGKVQLKRASNGNVFEMTIAKLSKADQAYVASFEVRFLDFIPPSGLKPQFTVVSREEKFAAIGYGKTNRDPLTTVVILDLNKNKTWRNISVGELDGGECRAVSDDGKYVLTEHQVTDSVDAQKRAKMSYYWTIWDCSKQKAVVATQMKKSPPEMFVNVATWIDESKVFIGNAEGKVKLLELKDGKFEEVYEKKVGDPMQLGGFAVSPNGKYFVVENGRKRGYDIHTTAECKRVQRVPSGSYLTHVALNNTMLVGVTSRYQTVAWDLRKKKLVGGGQIQRGGISTHMGSPAARMWPLGEGQAIFVRKLHGEFQVKGVLHCDKGALVGLSAPHVFTKGSDRRIWYVTDNGSEFRYQAYSIPMAASETIQAPGFE